MEVTYRKVRVPIKHLDGCGLVGIEHVPVVDGAVGNHSDGGLANPLPEDYILAHGGRLELLLLLQVEDLEGTALSPEGNDLTRPVHDGTIGLDGAADDIVAVLEVDNYHFGGRGIALLLANTDKGVRLECLTVDRC